MEHAGDGKFNLAVPMRRGWNTIKRDSLPEECLKEIIETNRSVSSTPELFCFGLLEKFDIVDLAAMVAPRPVVVKKPSDRAKKEFAKLAAWYKALGKDFDPLK